MASHQLMPDIRGDSFLNIDVSQLKCQFTAPDPSAPLPDPQPTEPNANIELLDVWDTVAPHIINLIAARSVQFTSLWCIENDIWVTVRSGTVMTHELQHSVSEDILALVKRFGVTIEEERGFAIKWSEGNLESLAVEI